jgi:hypothetical protein
MIYLHLLKMIGLQRYIMTVSKKREVNRYS